MKKGEVRAIILIFPAVALFILSFVLPVIITLRLSLFSTNFVTSKFVGIANYLKVFVDRDFLNSLATSLVYMLFVTPISVGISYLISLRLARVGKKERFLFQTMFYLPTLTTGIIISFVWRWVFGRTGLLSIAFMALGIEPIGWFSAIWPARFVLAFASTFSAIGGICIWLTANLLSISGEIYDQARVDGVSKWQLSWYIIIPIISKTLILVAMLISIGTLQYWELIFALTSGGPYKMTATPVFDIYTTAFIYSRHGYAAAKSMLLMIFLALVMGGRKLVERKKNE